MGMVEVVALVSLTLVVGWVDTAAAAAAACSEGTAGAATDRLVAGRLSCLDKCETRE